MNDPDLKPLLDLIGSKEGSTYCAIYGGKEIPLTTMTIKQVLAHQRGMKVSTACGRYQFLHGTLQMIMNQMALSADEIWDEALQDRMAIRLIKNRGLERFLAGTLSAEGFANNLAKEWASLPVVTPIKGAHRILKPGQSYYSGDGLNKAFHNPEDVLAVINQLKGTTMNDDLRKQADEAFKQELAQLKGQLGDKSPNVVPLAGIDLGGNFCDMAPKLIQSALGLLDTFAWLIPDKVELPLRAFLQTIKRVVLPTFCGAGASAETVQKKG